MGPSGSGKSTLLYCLAGLDSLTSGATYIGETDLTTLNDRSLTVLRRERIGFVFQAFNLVPTLTAAENITLPLALGGRRVDASWVNTLATSLRIHDRLRHRPSELSGGQQQRVAAATGDGDPSGAGVRRRAHRQPGLEGGHGAAGADPRRGRRASGRPW